MNKWQTITDMEVRKGEYRDYDISFFSSRHSLTLIIACTESLDLLSEYCRYATHRLDIETERLMSGRHSEFLIHAADVEGLCQGIDEELVKSK